MRRRRDGSRAQRTSVPCKRRQSSLGGRTTTRALVAVGAYMAQDLRDAEGLMRPALRRAAIRLALSPREPARRLGDAYLRLDPPAPDTDPRRREVIDVSAAIASSGHRRGAGRRAPPPEGGRADRLELARFLSTMSIC